MQGSPQAGVHGAVHHAVPLLSRATPPDDRHGAQNCVTISSIQDEDLLFFSHSNVALSHLPYMVALDRCVGFRFQGFLVSLFQVQDFVHSHAG